jgi:hypothetical protein
MGVNEREDDREVLSESPQDDYKCLDCHAVSHPLAREYTEEDG